MVPWTTSTASLITLTTSSATTLLKFYSTHIPKELCERGEVAVKVAQWVFSRMAWRPGGRLEREFSVESNPQILVSWYQPTVVFFKQRWLPVQLHSYYNNRATTLALNSLTVRSRLVKECLISLAVTSSYFVVKLFWVLGHNGIAWNCKAGELARGHPFKGKLHQTENKWTSCELSKHRLGIRVRVR